MRNKSNSNSSGGATATASATTTATTTGAAMAARVHAREGGALTPTPGVMSSSNVVGETPEGKGVAPTVPSSSSTAKKQRSIHDFFGGRDTSDSLTKATRKKRNHAASNTSLLDDEPVKKRIEYDDCDSSEPNSLSQNSESLLPPGGAAAAAVVSAVKPKRIDFGGICSSSQRSEPDIEPLNYDVVVSADPFARQASQGAVYGGGYSGGYSGGYGGGMFSQDDMDFCTPADQPVMHLSHPTTPSPIKKRQRLTHGGRVDHVQEEEVKNLTQDLTHMDVATKAPLPPHGLQTPRKQPAHPLPNFSSSDSSDMLLATPQRVVGLPAAFLPGGRRRHDTTAVAPPSLSSEPAVASSSSSSSSAAAAAQEAFTNPFAPLPVEDSRKRRPLRKPRQSFPPFSTSSVSVPYSRYLSEFVEQELLGSGAFSKVFKCVKKIDGWTYAIKKSKRHFRGRADTERALREVQALAALSDSRHIVRYFDAWIEDDLLYIQLEQCSTCSLATLVDQYKPLHVPEEFLCKVLSHLAQALQDMHTKQMVHMDVKLPNVLVAPGEIYKLGDLGTVAHADGSMEIIEGDNRYLSRELLEGSRSNLCAGDIFALGATIYELALGATLPNGGEEWQKIRDGDLTLFRQYSNSLQHLIASMMHPDPLQRPSAEEILQHEVVLPYRLRG